VAVVSNEGCPQAGVLAVGEPFDAGAQDIADPGERIILASAVAVDVLLDAAPDLVDGGGAELDDVERVQDCDVVVEPVGDGVLVVVERVQRGDLHAAAERVVAGLQPGRVGLADRPGTRSQRGVEVSMLVTGQIDHAGELFRVPPALVDGLGRGVMPDMLVEPSLVTPTNRSSSSSAASRTGRTDRHSVFHVQPSCRARPFGSTSNELRASSITSQMATPVP